MNYSHSTQKNVMHFTINGVDKSFANAIRRTLLGNIPIIVLKPQDCEITVNTSRFTNEIIKSRLACIPIHHKKITDTFVVKVEVKNETPHLQYATTEQFVPRELFPDYTVKGFNKTEKRFIEFLRLRPGEEINLSCKTSIGIANESGMYNSVGTCSYGFTQDVDASELAWKEKEHPVSKEDWDLLDGKRFVIPNSFDFVLESIGVFENRELLLIACDIMKLQLTQCKETMTIDTALTTIRDCYDVKITGDYTIGKITIPMHGDFTIGKMLEYKLYQRFKEDEITYIAFFKKHPHDVLGTLRVAFKDATTESVRQKVIEACDACISDCDTLSTLVNK